MALFCALPSHAVQTDEQILADFKVQAKRIQLEVITAGGDMAKVTALQKELQALLVDVSSKVSPKTRTALEVSLKVVNPLMDGVIIYTGAVQKYMEAGGFDYTSANTAEIIDRRLVQLSEVEELNAKLVKLANSFEADIEAVLKTSKYSDAEKAAFLKGFQSSIGSRMGAIRAVRNLDTRLYVEVRGVYGQLRDQLGKWSVKEGMLIFEDDAQADAYNARTERMTGIAKRQAIAQRQAAGIK